MELFRDLAADQFERHTGSSWRPRSGSMVNHRTLTAAMIDSRDFLAAKRRAETEVLLPAGPKIAFTGGLDFNDHAAIWDTLDKVHAKYPDMVLRMAAVRKAQSASPPAGLTTGRSRRSSSSRTGTVTPEPRRSSATTGSSTSSRSASSYSRARASRRISRIRRRSLASQSGSTAARERLRTPAMPVIRSSQSRASDLPLLQQPTIHGLVHHRSAARTIRHAYRSNVV